MDTRRKFLIDSAATALKIGTFASVATPILTSHAQNSGRPITLLVGYPSGGGPDMVARALVDKIRGFIDHSFLVDNKTGAGGRIALEQLKNGPVDGSMFVLTPAGNLTVHPHVYKKLPYDISKDFVPVCKVCKYSLSIVTSVNSPYKTLTEFFAWARKNKDTSFGAPGLGTAIDFTAYLLARTANIQLTPVSYRGGPQLTQAVVTGEIPLAINLSSNFTELARSGKVRILATTGAQRSKLTPDAPTLLELGYKDLVVEEAIGIVAKTGTPQAVIDRLQQAVGRAMAETDLPKILDRLEYPADFAVSKDYWTYVKSASARWKKVVEESGFQPVE